MKFISPRTELYTKIPKQNLHCEIVYVFCSTFNVRRSHNLKVSLALQWTGNFIPASHLGPSSPKTFHILRSSNFHPCL